MKGLTAEAVHDDPDQARKAAESVQESPTASPISQAVAAAVLLQRQEDIEESIEKWRAVATISEGTDKDLAAQAWFSVGYLSQEYEENALETAINTYDKTIRFKSDFSEAYNNRGNANISLNRADEAHRNFETAIASARDAGDETLVSRAQRALKGLSDEQDP